MDEVFAAYVDAQVTEFTVLEEDVVNVTPLLGGGGAGRQGGLAEADAGPSLGRAARLRQDVR